MALQKGKTRLAALVGMSLLLLLVLCGPAFAHAQLLEASPDEGETVSGAPEQVRLWFDEPVEAEFDPLKIYDSRGARIDEDNARIDPNDACVLVVDLQGPPGDSREDDWRVAYTVDWRVTSVDGHVVQDTYSFTVMPGETVGDAEPAAEPASSREVAEEHSSGGLASITGYSAVSLGVLGLAVVAVPVVGALRRRKAEPR